MTSSTQVARSRSKDSPDWNGRISISLALTGAIGLLVFISVGAVLGIAVWLAQKNTFSLLSKNAHISITAAVNRIEQHLKPSEYQAEYIANLITNGIVDPTEKEKLGLLLRGALAAAPQIKGVMFIDLELQSLGAARGSQNNKVTLRSVDHSNDPIITSNMTRLSKGKFWGPPIWRARYQTAYLNFAYPVRRGGKIIGAVVAVVSVKQLSGFVSEGKLTNIGQRFILYGRHHVLAHALMANGYPGRSNQNPLPRLRNFNDPAMASIWQQDNRYKLRLKMGAGTMGHSLDIDGERYIYVYRRIKDFGRQPFYVGAYFQSGDIGKEVARMKTAMAVAIAALLLSLIAAAFVGRQIAKPIIRISQASGRIQKLDISKVEELSGSVFRELNDQSSSFNSMLVALRWFELYVPKKVVAILVKRGGVKDVVSDERDITVMFTDIAGFSSAAENMPAHGVAKMLNHHFAILAKCIADQDGIVDKFIGDSVMAFWGAPQPQKNTAARACRAAQAISKAIRADNKRRAANGDPPIHIRIGIHTGPATVGNIGAPDRLNYTIIGDTVNIGQRLEQLGKQINPPGTDVAISISGATRAHLDLEFKPTSVGPHDIKGHAEPVDVYKLV